MLILNLMKLFAQHLIDFKFILNDAADIFCSKNVFRSSNYIFYFVTGKQNCFPF